jgi:hypothetical protein
MPIPPPLDQIKVRSQDENAWKRTVNDCNTISLYN